MLLTWVSFSRWHCWSQAVLVAENEQLQSRVIHQPWLCRELGTATPAGLWGSLGCAQLLLSPSELKRVVHTQFWLLGFGAGFLGLCRAQAEAPALASAFLSGCDSFIQGETSVMWTRAGAVAAAAAPQAPSRSPSPGPALQLD